MITTEANSLMSKIHNVKKRMPTILDDERANAWINEHLTEKQIQEIASYQFPADKMKAYTVAKNFQQTDNPTEHVNYTIFTPQTLF
jgi:putative SOS response-associated peptidase YedK